MILNSYLLKQTAKDHFIIYYIIWYFPAGGYNESIMLLPLGLCRLCQHNFWHNRCIEGSIKYNASTINKNIIVHHRTCLTKALSLILSLYKFKVYMQGLLPNIALLRLPAILTIHFTVEHL